MNAQLFDGVATLDTWQRGYKAEPDQWHQPGKCRYCGGTTLLPHLIESETGAFAYPVTACEPCIVVHRARYEADLLAATRAGLERFCPPDFAEQWDTTKGNNALLTDARKHFSLSTKRGLVLHGSSGRCKTRVAWEIIKDIEARPPFVGFVWRFSDGFELATTGIKPDHYNAGLLVIDDLGNEPAGTKWETGLLYLLRKRCDYHRPTIITTQLSGAQLSARFFGGASGAAILRRLMQRCTAIAG